MHMHTVNSSISRFCRNITLFAIWCSNFRHCLHPSSSKNDQSVSPQSNEALQPNVVICRRNVKASVPLFILCVK